MGAVLAGVLFSSCSAGTSSSPTTGETAAAPGGAPMETAEAPAAVQGQEAVAQSSSPEAPTAPKPKPQLVKTASLTLVTDSVDEGLQNVRQVVQQSQGDLMNLQDNAPSSIGGRRTVQMQLRVPQDKLDPTLEALRNLGTVRDQSLTADDVSDQLVDFEARLRNLKKTEETLLEIMKRSGEVADVLQVAQELSNVRNSIEQITAQSRNLQNRVAYSTVNLFLESKIAAPRTQQRSVQAQLVETWQSATRSLGEFLTNLIQLGIWLLVYSPILLVLAVVLTLLFNRWRRPRRISSGSDSSS